MSDIDTLVREFAAADAADREAGSNWTRETELRRSKALVALFSHFTCPHCGKGGIFCTRRAREVILLWQMTDNIQVHRAKYDLVMNVLPEGVRL